MLRGDAEANMLDKYTQFTPAYKDGGILGYIEF